MKKHILYFLCLIIFFAITGCQPKWSISFSTTDKTIQFDQEGFIDLKKRFPDNEYCEGLSLEQVLYEEGIEIVDSVDIKTKTGEQLNFPWKESAGYLCLNEKGEINFQDDLFRTTEIIVHDVILPQSYIHITDITTTALAALGLPHDDLPGNVLVDGSYEHVVLIFLDGFGFEKFQYASQNGMVDALSNSENIYSGITFYPPRTVTGSAAVLTGLPPKLNGVDQGTIRKTDSLTIFDRAKEAGISSEAIEGDALAFNLRNTNVELSGDRDLNGGTDDNVFANAINAIETRMPRLLWIHFHGIDDAGHSYGPESSLVNEKIIEINSYLQLIYSELPEDTLIIYFADHGMHEVDEEGRLGNHGHLIFEDMVIPVIIQSK